MNHSLTRAVRIALTVFLGLAFGPALTVEAAAFRVNPIRLNFDKGTQSALLTLINESKEQIRFQITAFSWTQKTDGEMKLEPTQDIVFFPALLTLNAGEQRKVRVGSVTKQGPMEKTYRVFFEELPSLETKEKPAVGSAVKILTKMGIPVFIAPESPQVGGEITNLALADGRLRFDLRNIGNMSFVAQSVTVTGLDANGAEAWKKQREGWYVLGADFRSYDVALSAEECRKTRKIVIGAQTNLPPQTGFALIKGEVPVSDSSCGTH